MKVVIAMAWMLSFLCNDNPSFQDAAECCGWFGRAKTTRAAKPAIFEDPHEWEQTVHLVLRDTPAKVLGLSSQFSQSLLMDNQEDNLYKNNYATEQSSLFDQDHYRECESLLFKGLACRPFYKIIAFRLCLLSIHHHDHRDSNKNEKPWLPAASFGFQEETVPSIACMMKKIPRGPIAKEIIQWFQCAGERGVMQFLLGMRSTIGTDPRGLFPPSWSSLVEAANLPHKKAISKRKKNHSNCRCNNNNNAALSVAARARAKHAHRGKDRFFGVAQGPPSVQNADAERVILRLLQDAAWINIHIFASGGSVGGEATATADTNTTSPVPPIGEQQQFNQQQPVLEIRTASGYGARWTANWSNCSDGPQLPTDIEFRGFLEPQMPDGHLKGWMH